MKKNIKKKSNFHWTHLFAICVLAVIPFLISMQSLRRIEAFSEVVFRAGYASPVRTPRGRDILAACGQLKSETEKLRARARLMADSGIGPEGLFVGADD